ncbi:MAG: hypothetical protein Q9203_000066 [Teloschistes exilis]
MSKSFWQIFTVPDTQILDRDRFELSIRGLVNCGQRRPTISMPALPKQRKIAIVGSRSVGKWLRRGSPTPWSMILTSRCAGKSSLTVQFVEGHFVESYYPTIENTFSRLIKCGGQEFATEIVDTAGQVSAHPTTEVHGRATNPNAAACSDRPARANIRASAGA